MEEFPDLLSRHNFSNNLTELSPEENPETDINATNERNIIENLIRQLNDPDSKSEVSNLENIEKQNNDLKLQDPPNLDEILEADEASITPNSHNVSVINAACQQLLKQIEQQLLASLKKNRKEQEVVLAFLNDNCKNSFGETPKKDFLKCAGIPYFKDSNGFLPPPNEDVLRKKRNKKLLPIDHIKNFPVWKAADAKTLINAVNKYDTSRPSSIDWMKISVTDLEGKYSPSECKSKWNMHLNPNINRSKWSSKEMNALKNLSSKYNYQDWDKIAAELGTNRTGLQCCIQYQVHTFPTEGKWTKEEDENLKALVEKYRVKDYIPWTKVAWHFEKRSQKQCQERYVYHLANIKKGNFSMEEDFVIVYLASKMKNFGEVAKFLPKRVSTQIRSRYEYLVELSMPVFSKEEDELLIKLMAKYPRNWGKISEHFKNRSRVQCRKRWAHLQKTIKLEGEINSESDGNESVESVDSDSESNTMALMNSHIDADNVKRNMHFISKRTQGVKKYPAVYSKLLDYHSYCHKFLFGPKPRVPSNSEDLKELTTKMFVTMKTLSISPTGPLDGFDMSQLFDNCEFSHEDVLILNNLKRKEQQPRGFELSQKFIPPNFMTILALRTFTLAWDKIRHYSSYHVEANSSTSEVSSDDRMLCSDAKKLFKSRLKTIFSFPLILSNISQKEKPSYKTKARKAAKPLSKRKRKEHAKFMSATYRNKLKSLSEQFPDTHGLLGDRNTVQETESRKESFGSSANGGKIGKKRPHSSTTGSEPLKKRQTRKAK